MIVIYHSRDLDGFCSGGICKKKYPDAVLIGYDYGEPFPWDKIPKREPVIMVDVSLPMEDMQRLANISLNFTWIDHHASAIKAFQEFPFYLSLEPAATFVPVLQDGIAACEGTWWHLFPDEDMPRAVQLLGEYDTWRDQDKHRWDNIILPFQYGMRRNIRSAASFPQHYLSNSVAYQDIHDVIFYGNVILEYQKQQNTKLMEGSFVIDFKGYRALCCNGCSFNSTAFESAFNEDYHDLMMPFRFDGTQWIFSMYTTKDIDLSILAKEMGGGGHKKACGFKLTELPDFIFKQVIN